MLFQGDLSHLASPVIDFHTAKPFSYFDGCQRRQCCTLLCFRNLIAPVTLAGYGVFVKLGQCRVLFLDWLISTGRGAGAPSCFAPIFNIRSYMCSYIYARIYDMQYNFSILPLLKQFALARKNAGISQAALGTKLEMPQSYISAIESGKHNLRLSAFLDIARMLGLEVMLVPVSMVPTVSALLEESTGSRSQKRKGLYSLSTDEDLEDETYAD